MKNRLNKRYIKGFTLVELIIVITILGILATIAFISFQGYSKNARDGNRITTMKNIGKGLEVYKVQVGNYPQPDDSINIEASGTIIGYQGNVGDSISRLIKMNVTPTDPSDKEKYLYSISGDKKKYQVLGYLETTDYLSLLPQIYAIDYSNRYIKTEGDKVGVILDVNKSPITGVPKIEVATGSTVYNVYFGSDDIIKGSGSILFSNMSTRRVDLSNNKNLVSIDDSLVGYWDMETLSGGKLRDFSKYGNDGTINGLITVGGVDGKKGKATNFSGNSTYITTPSLSSYGFGTGDYTIMYYINFNSITAPGGFTIPLLINTGGSHYNYFLSSNGQLGVNKHTVGGILSTSSQADILKSYFIVNSRKNGILNLYLNGTIVGTTANSDNLPAGMIYIGGISGGYNLNGYMDEVKIYNRALSDSEVQELYNSTK